MTTFFQNIITHISAKNAGDWSRTLLLFPNHRSVYYFRELLKNDLETGSILPTLKTFEDFVLEQSVYRKAEPMELLFSMYATYKKQYPETTLHHFLPVAKTMLNDFSEIDSELVNAKQFFRDLEALKSMNVYMEDDEEKVSRYKYFWKTFNHIYNALQLFCNEHKKAYSGFIYKDVVEHIGSISVNAEQVYFIGFTQLSKAEKTIAAELLKKYESDYLVDVDEFYLKDLENTAGLPYRKIFKDLKIQKPLFISNGISTTEKQIHIIPCNGKHQQIQAAFEILKAQNIAESERPKTALILPDASLLPSLIADLPEQYSDANISTGFSMKDSVIVRFVKQLFAVMQYAKVFNEKRHYHIKFLRQLLEFPFFETSLPKWSDKLVYISADKLRTLTNNEALIDFLETVNDIQSGAKKLAELVETLTTTRLSDTEKLFVTEAKSILAASQEMTANGSVEDYFFLLLDTLKNHSLPFDVNALKGLQVMGIMESRNLDYENVFLFSLNEGTFPTSGKGNSYIPYEMRMAYLTSPLEKEAISAYLFYRLLHRTSNLYLFYNTNQDLFAGGEPSRFLLQLKLELSHFSNITIKEYEVSASTDITDASELQMVQKNEEDISRVKKYLSENGLSPSALNTYINCKMQFYYRYIISVKPEEELSETIEANVLGSAVHEVLEMLYKPFIGKNISATDVAKMQDGKRIEGLAKDFLSKEFDTKLLNGKNYLLYKVVVKLSLMFLKNEEAFLKKKNTIHLLELEQELNTEITIGETSVKLKGLADRIDELNNVLRIVDYKTGKIGAVSLKDISSESLLKPEASKQFQLLMYAWLYNRVKKTSTIISGIYWLRNPSNYFNQLEINKDSIIRNEHLQGFESVLSNLIQEILSETTPFIMTDNEKRCKHCDFKNLCERAVVV